MGGSPQKRTARVRIHRFKDGRPRERLDHVAVEEPMELRIEVPNPDGIREVPVSVTMRTPGDDFELAVGFLFTEGILLDPTAVSDVRYCQNVEPQEYNVVTVALRTPDAYDAESLGRNFYVTSSCGVCGKASLEAVEVLGCAAVPDTGFRIAPEVLAGVPDALSERQKVFDRTGGIHAAGLFDSDGTVHLIREDVGRHNAVDKVLGHQLLGHQLPLAHRGLVVSGRTSFEILQKAAMCGIPMVVAVGAPSSLAVDMAKRFNLTLTGFTQAGRFNVYSVPERIVGPEAT